MATMNISVTDAMRRFVETEVAQGGYTTTSEYFRDLIREKQQQRANQRLEALLLEALDSGEAEPVTPQEWEDIRREVRERLASRKK